MKGKYLVVLSSLLCLTACSGIYEDNKDSTTSKDTTSNEVSEDTSSAKPSTDKPSSDKPSSDKPSTDKPSSDSTSSEVVDQIIVKSVADNKSISDFEAIKEDSTFKVNNEVYEIGDDNAFDFKPEIKVAKKSAINDSYTPESWEYLVDLQLVDGENLSDVNINENTYIESLNRVTCKIDFTEAAVGKTFKFTVTPVGLTEKQQNNPTFKSIFELRVQDGYNVYHENELAYVNDGTGSLPDIPNVQPAVSAKEVWDAFIADKDNHLKPLEKAPKGLYIHKDLTLTKKNIPSAFFLNKAAAAPHDPALEGKLLDNVEIYRRRLGENDSFVLNGNYFKLDASNLDVVGMTRNGTENGYKYDKNAPQTSHAQLFLFDGENSGNVLMKNFNAIGNAMRTNDVENSGGLIFNKVESQYGIGEKDEKLRGKNPAFEIYNTNCTGWFISFFPSYSTSPYKVNKCKATNSFNTFVYNYGCDKLEIVDCDMKGAGGPVIIQDYVFNKENGVEMVSHTKVIDSNLVSIVAGTEGWFHTYNVAPLVPQVKQIASVLGKQVGKTFTFTTDVEEAGTPVEFFNFIAINKGGDSESATNTLNLKGTIEFVHTDKKHDDAKFDYGATNPVVKGAYQGTAAAGAPLFETSKGGLATFNGTNIASVADATSKDAYNATVLQATLTEYLTNKTQLEAAYTPEQLAENADYQKLLQGIALTQAALNMQQGDKLCFYFNGMAIVTDYNAVKSA